MQNFGTTITPRNLQVDSQAICGARGQPDCLREKRGDAGAEQKQGLSVRAEDIASLKKLSPSVLVLSLFYVDLPKK